MKTNQPWKLAGLALACFVTLGAHAQTITQTFTLQNGWNAIYLEVSPPNGSPTNLFAGLPVASVWTRLDKLSSVDFIQDSAEVAFNEAGWLKWYPPPQPEFLSDLRELQGQRAYLIKLTNGPATWQVTGQPVARAIQWVPNAWNLRGFPVDSNSPPTFRNYFQPSAAHYDSALSRPRGIYRLGASGTWALADQDAPMRAGEACWVYCQGASSFTGPLELSLDTGETLDFGQTQERINVQFNCLAAGSRTVTLHHPLGAAAPGVLAYQRFNTTNGFYWADLPDPFAFAVTNGSARTLNLAVRRSHIPGTNYATVLDITDSQGSHYRVPITAERFGLSYAGLWVGSVTVNAVSEPHFGALTTNLYALVDGQATSLSAPGLAVTTNTVVTTNADLTVVTNTLLVVRIVGGAQVPVYEKVERDVAAQSPTPTKSEFTMRLLIHVDAGGQSRLLKEVVQMWRDGTYTNNSEGYRSVDKPGGYVLLTRDALLSQFKGATLRDGVPVGRRLSAIGFDFDGNGTNDMTLSGTFAPGQSLTGAINIASDYPLNPFRHKYHPDHDNLDAMFNPISDPAKKEAYAVTRQLQFEFAASASGNAANPDPAYSAMQGIYRETLAGLHKQPIIVQGTFQLSRASFIVELNPSPTP